MKANAKYTALELLESVGRKFEIDGKKVSARDAFGKAPIGIGGLAIVQPTKLITVQPETDFLSAYVGVDVFQIDFEGDHEERIVSEAARKVLDA
jgi:hypothetical protein